jgi:hypothetical protein
MGCGTSAKVSALPPIIFDDKNKSGKDSPTKRNLREETHADTSNNKGENSVTSSMSNLKNKEIQTLGKGPIKKHYKFIKRIGKGAFGNIYSAVHRITQ